MQTKIKVVFVRPYNVMDVANYVIQYFIDSKHPIPNLLLIKMLYYLQADSLRLNGEPLFNEQIEKWGYGPTEPEVFSYFKLYDAAPIDSSSLYLAYDNDRSWRLMNPAYRTLAPRDTWMIDHLIDEIYNRFHDDPFKLVEFSKKEPMWQQDEAAIRKGNMHLVYDINEMKTYFQDYNHWPWHS